MHITCPYCQFSQDVPADRLPASSGKSLLATCPHCACRFRLFLSDGTTQPLDSPATPREQPASTGEGPRAGQPAPETVPPRQKTPRRDPEEEKEEEDPRLTASRAYEREAERGRRLREAERQRNKDAAPPAALRNPWEEAPETIGYIEAFYQTVLRVMFAAPRFFLGVRDDAPPLRALLFFLVTGVLGVTALTLWGNVFRGMMADAADPQLQALAAMLPQESGALLYGLIQLFLLVMQLYVVSALVFLSFRLSGCRSATYARVFQILAYSSAPMLLCAVPVLGYLAGFIWCLASVVIGCRAAFRLNWARTVAGCLPIVLLLLMLLQQTLGVLSKF